MFKLKLGKGISLDQCKEPALSKAYKDYIDETKDISYINGKEENFNIDKLSSDGIISICKEAGITDEIDGAPLHDKIKKAKNSKVHQIIVSAVDDQPYISNQTNVLLQRSDLVIGGIEILCKALNLDEVHIAVYKNMGDIDSRIPRSLNKIPVKKVDGKYPIHSSTTDLFSSKGALIVSATSVAHLHRAVTQGRKQTTAFITVAGSSIYTPINMEVPLGMSIASILQRCSLKYEPDRIVVGGSMTGQSIANTETTVISPTTKAVLAFKEHITGWERSCIGCGRCIDNCPENLAPMYIYKFIENRLYKSIRKQDIHNCTCCGVCSYVCPAKLDLSNSIFNFSRTHRSILEEQKIRKYKRK